MAKPLGVLGLGRTLFQERNERRPSFEVSISFFMIKGS